MPQLTIQEILAMKPGSDLDKAVHAQALGRPGIARAYSTKPESAIEIVNILPIGVARLSQQSAGYKPERPFIAFVLERANEKQPNYFTAMAVTAATLPIALSKMALIFTTAPKEGLRARPAGNSFPKIGGSLQPRQLDPMPKRKMPEVPVPPGSPIVAT